MPPILISAPKSLSPEEWLWVNLAGTQGGQEGPDLVAVSGYAHYDFDLIKGSEDTDMLFVDYALEMLVGPLWRRVVDVSPTVHVAGYESQEADEADMMGYHIHNCSWEFPEPSPNKIRLKVSLAIGGGEQASITTLAYHFMARGLLVPGQNFKQNV